MKPESEEQPNREQGADVSNREVLILAPINPLASVHLLSQFLLLRRQLEDLASEDEDSLAEVRIHFLSFGEFVWGVQLFADTIEAHFGRLMPPRNGDLARNVINLKAAEIGSVAQLVLANLMQSKGEPLCPARLLRGARFSQMSDYLEVLRSKADPQDPEYRKRLDSLLSTAGGLVKRLADEGDNGSEAILSGNLASVFASPNQQGVSLLSAMLAIATWHCTVNNDEHVVWLADKWVPEVLDRVATSHELPETEREMWDVSKKCIATLDRDFSPDRVRFFLTPFSEYVTEPFGVGLSHDDACELAVILHELNCDLFERPQAVMDFTEYLKELGKDSDLWWKKESEIFKLRESMPRAIDDLITHGFTAIEKTLVEQIRYIL